MRSGWGGLQVALLGGALAGLVAVTWSGPAMPAGSAGAAARTVPFGFCHTGGGTDCVVDGDTFWMGGEKIRVADIDAPETHPSRCAAEARLGNAATARCRCCSMRGP